MRAALPTEHEEQCAVVQWAKLMERRDHRLALLFAIPQAGKMRGEGVKAGVPDLCLPVAKDTRHGLFIEMKRRKGGRLSAEQRWWATKLTAQGYEVFECRGADEAIAVLETWLNVAPPRGNQ